MPLKIVSWNVNGIRACARQELEQFLRAEDPDIVCLQEIKATYEQCRGLEIWQNLPKYDLACHSAVRPGYSGVLTLIKHQSVRCRIGCGEPRFDAEGRVVVSDFGTFCLANLYFPNGGSGPLRHDFKMQFLIYILEFFSALDKEKPLLMTGDFNIAHKPIDIHDPIRLNGMSGFMPVEREWMDLLIARGFVDTFRYLNPSLRDQYSWWSYRQGARRRNKGWRIDYFFISERWKGKVLRSVMYRDVKGSDHCPLGLTLTNV